MKKTLFQKDMCLIAEDSSEESEIEYAETSDEDGVSDDEIIEGDKVTGKSRVVHYIARIDVVESMNMKASSYIKCRDA